MKTCLLILTLLSGCTYYDIQPGSQAQPAVNEMSVQSFPVPVQQAPQPVTRCQTYGNYTHCQSY